MTRTDTLSDLSVFVAVASLGSFTAAAEQLGMSKSQASKCVARIEQTLGARLLQRTTRRLRLTEAGSTLFDSGKRALAEIDEAQMAVSRLQREPRGTLVVGASIAFGSVQLPSVLRELAAKYPQLAVDLRLEDRHIDLVREGVDVAIRITADAMDSSLVYRRLGRNRQVVCASPAYLESRGTPLTPHDLTQHECIAHTQRATPRTWQFTTPGGGRTTATIDGRIAISGSLAVRQAALEGMGVIELNSYLVGPEIAAGRLVRLLPGYEPRELSFYAVYPQRRYLAPKVRVFVEALLARMSPEPVWDAFLGIASTPRHAAKAGAALSATASARASPR
jgi:DNA-binding transcriptional LysR family regulator